MFLSLYFQEDNYETDIEVDGCPLKVELIDTAGNVSKQNRKAHLQQWWRECCRIWSFFPSGFQAILLIQLSRSAVLSGKWST